MRKAWVLLAAATALTLVAAACGGDEEGGGGTTVSVDLNEWSVSPDPSSVPAGEVTFVAKNAGAVEHELVVLKTDLAADAVPVKESKADEHAPGITEIGEIEEFAAGETESATFDLSAGKYVLICNISGHYAAGMRVAFQVT